MFAVLAVDRDADVLPRTLDALAVSLRYHLAADGKAEDAAGGVGGRLDLCVSLRLEDVRARAACQAASEGFGDVLRLRFVFCDSYETSYESCEHNHEAPVLQSIANRRDELRRLAVREGRPFLVFVDSDVLLREDTVHLLVTSGADCVGAAYAPRWSCYPVCGIALAAVGGGDAAADADGDADGRAKEQLHPLQLIVNPHWLRGVDAGAVSVPVAVIGFGATLLRESVLDVPIVVAREMGVEGEDVGLCLELLERGVAPHVLVGGHVVEHLSAGRSDEVYMPRISGVAADHGVDDVGEQSARALVTQFARGVPWVLPVEFTLDVELVREHSHDVDSHVVLVSPVTHPIGSRQA